MMKFIFILSFLICYFISFSQYTINQSLGSGNTRVFVPPNGALQASLINRAFTDTTAANLTNIDFYAGAQIYTSSDNLLWYRNAAATAWVQVANGLGGLFARTDARNNTAANMYFSAADQSFHFDSLFNFNVTTTSGSMNFLSAGGITLQSVNGSSLSVNNTDVAVSALDSMRLIYQTTTPTISALGDYKFQVRSPAGGFADYTGSIATLAANGVTNVGDTIQQGGSIIKFTYIEVPSHLRDGAPFTHIRYGNLPEAQSIGGVVPPYPTALTYNPSTIGIDRWYKESNGDTAVFQYGGAMSTVTRQSYDSNSTRFRFDNKDIRLPSQGYEALYQIMLPRDSTRFRISRDGQQASVAVMQSDFGDTWGYNTQVYSDVGIPDMPISTYKANLDFQRNIDNTRRYKMTGNGVAQYLSAYKTYQTEINGSTYEAGNYVSKVMGFHAYGPVYTNLSTNTKAKTLLVSTVDSSFGFVAEPQYRYTNDIKNGYGLWMKGDSDYNHINGWLNVGGTLPTRGNSGQAFVHRFNVTGDMWASDTAHGFIVDGLGYSVRIPQSVGTEAGIAFWIQDTVQQQADISMIQPSNFNSRVFRVRVGNTIPSATYSNDGTGFRIEFQTGANSVNISKIWRNGNWTIGTGLPATDLRLYKKFTVDGGGAFFDTLRLVNLVQQGADTAYKPIVTDAIGNLYKGYWAYAGGGGASAWNSITNPTGTQTLTFDDGELNAWAVSSNTETFHTYTANSLTTGMGILMTLNGLTDGKGISITSSSTAKAAGNALFNANSSGVNVSSGITNVGYLSTVANTGTSSVNTGFRANVSGASTNWAFYADAGNVRTTGASGFYSQNTAGTAGISIAYDNSSIGALSTIGGVRLDLDAASSTILMRRQTNIGLGIDFGNVPSFQVYKSGSGTSNIQNWLSSGGTILASVNQSGRFFIGSSTSATALLHLGAGTATANTAPLKFESGTNLTTAEAGAVEFDGTNFFGTASTTRYTFAKTLTNTATLDFDLTAVNYQDLNVTLTGSDVNDAVSFSVGAAAWVADVTYSATVTATNTVTIRCSRVGGGGAANPGSATFRVVAIKY